MHGHIQYIKYRGQHQQQRAHPQTKVLIQSMTSLDPMAYYAQRCLHAMPRACPYCIGCQATLGVPLRALPPISGQAPGALLASRARAIPACNILYQRRSRLILLFSIDRIIIFIAITLYKEIYRITKLLLKIYINT